MSQKIMVLPDIHGRTTWYTPAHDFLEQNPNGHIVCLGDYNDSFDVQDQQMLGNFTDIILFKEQYPELVTLLLGNHDFPYISSFYTCSGNNKRIWGALNILFKEHAHLFQLSKQVDTTLFVHAGLTNGWLDCNRNFLDKHIQSLEELVAAKQYDVLLNAIYHNAQTRSTLYQASRTHGGYDAYDGPVWVRPRQLLYDAVPGIHQVVGHTQMRLQTSVTETALNDSAASVTFTDCMASANWQPLILDL